jgi:hypothetical protein
MHLEDKSTARLASHELDQHSLETAAIIRERDGDLIGATRRAFLRQALGFATASSAFGISVSTGKSQTNAGAANIGSEADRSRRAQAFRVRVAAAQFEKEQPMPNQIDNGDETRYPNKIGSFSKGLPHNDVGEVDPVAYAALLHAISSGKPADFESIPMGDPDSALRRKFVNPQAGLAFDLEGADSHALAIRPAPAFNSAEEAGEIVENYWMALLRDVPFSEYQTNQLAHMASADLSKLSDFRGPRIDGHVTPACLFRGLAPGDLNGPYLSQFLLLPAPFGVDYIEQRMRCPVAGIDFLADYSEWLDIQKGFPPQRSLQYDPERRYIRNGRDISQWVHIDVLYQAYFHAMMILLRPSDASDLNSNGLGAYFDSGNPYASSHTQEGFGTFGAPHVAALMCEVASRALKTVWYQKWFVHRRLRPEVFAGRIHNHLSGVAHYPFAEELFGSRSLFTLHAKTGNYLLPMAFPEGSPLHPAYGAGHATVAGACVTILKAWFDESFVIPNPVVAASDGLSLVAYDGPSLTIGGELNKLASNIAIGRNIAGVHWRSDATESLKLGEALAISVLRDQRVTYSEPFQGFTLTKFDGTTIRI